MTSLIHLYSSSSSSLSLSLSLFFFPRYLGKWSDDRDRQELPSWESVTPKGAYVQEPSKDKLLCVLCWLLERVDPLLGLSSKSFHALQQLTFSNFMFLNHAKYVIESKTLLECMIKGNASTSMVLMRNIDRRCMQVHASSHDFQTLLKLIATMLVVEDQFTETRHEMLFMGSDAKGNVKGLLTIAKENMAQAHTNTMHAQRAYTAIKIIGHLDQQVPAVRDWLVTHRESWVDLVRWLDTEVRRL